MPSKIDDTLFSWEEDGFGARNRDRWRISCLHLVDYTVRKEGQMFRQLEQQCLGDQNSNWSHGLLYYIAQIIISA